MGTTHAYRSPWLGMGTHLLQNSIVHVRREVSIHIPQSSFAELFTGDRHALVKPSRYSCSESFRNFPDSEEAEDMIDPVLTKTVSESAIRQHDGTLTSGGLQTLQVLERHIKEVYAYRMKVL